VHALLASIPSPSRNTIELGPLTIRFYGLALVLGILAAVFIAARRWEGKGGDRDLAYRVSMWGVVWGIIGARLYHVITSWDEVPDEWWGVFAVWKGGLGIWGGVALGVTAGAIVGKRHGANVALLADAFAPAIMVAQVIGRLGNYFNQELYGRPTGLPWSLEIAPENRPDEHASQETFHPLFLYEMLWNSIGIVFLLWLDRRRWLRPGGIWWLYVMWYSLGRAAWAEPLRIDPSHHFGGMRLNGWIAIGLFLVGLAGLLYTQRRRPTAPDAATAGVREPG
jgi:prolipoprotein diacylglyceryl transferase